MLMMLVASTKGQYAPKLQMLKCMVDVTVCYLVCMYVLHMSLANTQASVTTTLPSIFEVVAPSE
jgi:hypothetical protein